MSNERSRDSFALLLRGYDDRERVRKDGDRMSYAYITINRFTILYFNINIYALRGELNVVQKGHIYVQAPRTECTTRGERGLSKKEEKKNTKRRKKRAQKNG